jgi:serine/threonine protein kinase/tetratricopeptide (TPR) repeat protein
MGQVYRARDTRLGRDVAIKILPPAFAADPENIRRFEKEARAVASLSHPNVVPLFDVGEQEGVRYAVAELVAGETLRTRLAAGSMNLKEAAGIAAGVADGLAAAHEKGVVHRDIKPENIVLTPAGTARILDFGLAKRSDSEIAAGVLDEEPTRSALLTEPGVIAGTVGYMSPEQVRGEAVDGRSDVFSLGVVLWEMLAGRRPFRGDSQVETLNAILKEEPQPELALDALPPELTRIVRRCLEKRKEARYHSAADLAHDLRTAASGVKTRGTRPSTERPRSAGRTPLLLGALLLLLVAVAAILFVTRRSSPAPSTLPRTLAVLPFRAINADGLPAHFGLGLADSLIGRLASIRDLTVRPTSSIARYETAVSDASEIGRRLGVDALLEGTYQKLEGMTRVSVQMTDVSRGALLWSDRIDLPEGKLFELQDAISRQVVEKLRLELGPSEKHALKASQPLPDSVLEKYLSARARLIEASTGNASLRQQIVTSFDEVLAEQPDFAPALGARAYSRAWLTFVQPSVETYRAAVADAERAIALEPDLAEPRVARASLAWSSLGGWDVVKAVRELKLAISRSPNLDIAHFDLARIYIHSGWLSEAEEELRAGERINPSGEAERQRAAMEAWTGQWREALKRYDRLPEPTRRTWTARWQVAFLRAVLEDPREYEGELERLRREADEDIKATFTAILAIVRARSGREISDLERDVLSADVRAGHFHHVFYDLAVARAIRGDTAGSLEMLRRTAETGMPCAPCFEGDRYLAPIRGSKEYAALKEEIARRNAGYRAALKGVL